MEPPPLAKRLGGTADSFRVYNGMLIEKMVRKKISPHPAAGRSQTPSSRAAQPSYNLLDIQLATRDQVYPNIGTIYDLAYVEGSATMKMKSSLLWYESFLSSDIPKKIRILKCSNVKYWVTEDYEQLPSAQNPRGIKKVNVLEGVLPRAFLVGESRVVPSAEMLDIYYDSAFDPLEQVLLTEPVEVKKGKKFFRPGRANRIWSKPGRSENQPERRRVFSPARYLVPGLEGGSGRKAGKNLSGQSFLPRRKVGTGEPPHRIFL